MRLPAFLLRDTIEVEPYLGASGDGPIYGPPVAVRCFLASSERSVRQPAREGSRLVKDVTTAYIQCEDAHHFAPEARVTLHGRRVEVEAVRRHEIPGGPTPNHVEVTLL